MSYVMVDIPRLRDHIRVLRETEEQVRETRDRLLSEAVRLRFDDRFEWLRLWNESGRAMQNLIVARQEAERVLERCEAIADERYGGFAPPAGTLISWHVQPLDSGGLGGSDRYNYDLDDLEEPGDPEAGTPGPAPYEGGLGDALPPHPICLIPPDAPAWAPRDEDSGEWASRKPTLQDELTYAKMTAAVVYARTKGWADAARNLDHYLGGTGEDLEQPVDRILEEEPGFADTVEQFIYDSIAGGAVDMAVAEGVTGPVSFPVNTPWESYRINRQNNENWYLALGDFNYNVSGQVTVFPPDSPGGHWRYEVNAVINLRDRYNWDADKGTKIDGQVINDEELNSLREAGMAQTFTMTGRSSLKGYHGEI